MIHCISICHVLDAQPRPLPSSAIYSCIALIAFSILLRIVSSFVTGNGQHRHAALRQIGELPLRYSPLKSIFSYCIFPISPTKSPNRRKGSSIAGLRKGRPSFLEVLVAKPSTPKNALLKVVDLEFRKLEGVVEVRHCNLQSTGAVEGYFGKKSVREV